MSILFLIRRVVRYKIHAGFYTFLIISRSISRNPAAYSSLSQYKVLLRIAQAHQRFPLRNTGITKVSQAEFTFSVQNGDIWIAVRRIYRKISIPLGLFHPFVCLGFRRRSIIEHAVVIELFQVIDNHARHHQIVRMLVLCIVERIKLSGLIRIYQLEVICIRCHQWTRGSQSGKAFFHFQIRIRIFLTQVSQHFQFEGDYGLFPVFGVTAKNRITVKVTARWE